MTYDHSALDALPNASRQMLYGTAIDSGCAFNIAGSVSADFRDTIITREVVHDPTTCRSLIDRAVIPATGVQAAAQAGTKFGQWTGHWRDPINLNVNWNRSKLTWTIDRTNNTIRRIVSASCPYYRLTATGWYVSYDSGCSTGYVGEEAYRVESSRTFENHKFPCSPVNLPIVIRGATTRVHDHQVTGKGDGTFPYSTNMSKSGPCSWLLWSETRLTYR